MVESTKMASQMASWVQSLQTVQPLIVLRPLTENNQPVTTFPAPTFVLVNFLNVWINVWCAGSLNASVEDQLSSCESLLGTCKLKHRQPVMIARWRRRWETSDDMQQATTVWHLMLDLTVAGVARLPQDSKVLYRFWSSNLRRRWEIVVTFVCEAFKILHMIFLISDLIRSCMISTNEIIDQTQPHEETNNLQAVPFPEH